MLITTFRVATFRDAHEAPPPPREVLSTENRLWLHPDNAPKELTLEEQDALGWFAPRPLNQDANAGAWSHASKLSKKHPMWGEDEQRRDWWPSSVRWNTAHALWRHKPSM